MKSIFEPVKLSNLLGLTTRRSDSLKLAIMHKVSPEHSWKPEISYLAAKFCSVQGRHFLLLHLEIQL